MADGGVVSRLGFGGAGLLAAGVLTVAAAGGAHAADIREGSALSCAALSASADPSVTVTTAAPIAATAELPAHCQVKARVHPVPGSDIGFEVWLPLTGWNGKLHMYGNGGYSSALPAPAMRDGLEAGYAVVGTDTGHAGGDPDFARGKPEAIVDWGHRAVHESVVRAKAMVARFYGAPARYTYFEGCSTGGQQALMEAQRYPADFDGIIAGHPGSNRTHLNTGFLWLFLSNREPGQNGRPIIPASKLPMIAQASYRACRGANGSATAGGHAADPYLNDPLSCRFDPASIRCRGADRPDCLTPAQVGAMRKIYDGPRNRRTGERIYFGWPVGSEATWSAYWEDGRDPTQPMRANFWRVWAFDDRWNWWDFDFDTDMKRVDDRLAPVINAMDADLEPFRRRGGKLIQYHGLADSTVPAADSVSYFERVLDRYGGDEAMVAGFYRLFLAPGMGHCGGGPGPNVLQLRPALEDWVERGVAPAQVVAARFTDNDRSRPAAVTRPLCPYPGVARHRGGSPNEAASFACTPGRRRSDLRAPAQKYLR